jgi:hypothetical protein
MDMWLKAHIQLMLCSSDHDSGGVIEPIRPN